MNCLQFGIPSNGTTILGNKKLPHKDEYQKVTTITHKLHCDPTVKHVVSKNHSKPYNDLQATSRFGFYSDTT